MNEQDFKAQVWKENPAAIKIRFNRNGPGTPVVGFDILKSAKLSEKMLVEPHYLDRDVVRKPEVPHASALRAPPDASEAADSGVQPPAPPPVQSDAEYGAGVR